MLEPGQALGMVRDVGESLQRVGTHVCGVVGDVVLEADVLVGQGTVGMREDEFGVDVGEAVEVGIAVGAQEVVPGPGT